MQKMSCEQIYNIWISEPNLIRIVDVRSAQDYNQRHIPGAILATAESLPQVIWENRQRLLVFFSDKDENELPDALFGADCVQMDKPSDWFEKKWPFTGRLGEGPSAEGQQESLVRLETHRDVTTGRDSWLLIDDQQRELCCVNAHTLTLKRWAELKAKGYALLFVLRTDAKAEAFDFQLARAPGARLCVPREFATPEIDIPLESGQEMLFGERVIRVFEGAVGRARPGLEIDFCGRYRVG